jgi:hypothetical protein
MKNRTFFAVVAALYVLNAGAYLLTSCKSNPSHRFGILPPDAGDAGHVVCATSGTFSAVDASAANCGPHNAVCGSWQCTGGSFDLSCVSYATKCGTLTPDAGALCYVCQSELSDSVLGSAAQSVPGGVFCPGIPFSVNILTDSRNCGACGNNCNPGATGGYFCLNGRCGVP